MQLNGIDIDGYSENGGLVTFMVLAGADGLSALEGTDQFKVTDDGEDYEDFGGYSLLSLKYVAEGRTEVTIMRSLSPETAALLGSALENLSIASRNIDEVRAAAGAANAAATGAGESAATANSLAEANAAAIEEIAATVFAE